MSEVKTQFHSGTVFQQESVQYNRITWFDNDRTDTKSVRIVVDLGDLDVYITDSQGDTEFFTVSGDKELNDYFSKTEINLINKWLDLRQYLLETYHAVIYDAE